MTSRVFKHLYFLRFSIAGWVFLPVLCVLDWSKTTASITRGILTLDNGWQAYYAAFFVVAMQMTALITARNTVRNGGSRFCDSEEDRFYRALTDSSSKTVWRVLGIAHIPTALTLAYLAYNAARECTAYKLPLVGEDWWCIFAFFAAGLGAALAFWYLVSLFYYWTYRPAAAAPGVPAVAAALVFPHTLFGNIAEVSPPRRLSRWIDGLTRFFLSRFSYRGYAASSSGPLWELHFLSTVSLVGIFLVYLFLYPLTAPVLRSDLALYLETGLCMGITGLFLGLIADAGCTTPAGGHCTWGRPVKWLFVAVALVAAAVFLVSVWYDHATGSVRLSTAFPTFGSVLVLAVFFLWLFGGAAFFLDRYRVPVLTVVLGAIFVPKLIAPHVAECLVKIDMPWAAEIFDSDHFFTVKRLDKPMTEESIPTPGEVLARRVQHPDEPYIIVTASGGGIQAAAWTSQVLARLETRFAQDGELHSKGYTFHDHLLLASGVSGGSVGLMPYLLEYTGKSDASHPAGTLFPVGTADLPTDLAWRITRPADCSSLEAVGWGLSYHDLSRLLLPIRIPPVFPDGSRLPGDSWAQAVLSSDTQPDRSWALAAAMNRNLHDEHCGTLPHAKRNPALFSDLPVILDGDGMTLKGAAQMLREKGTFPAFTFNTTAEETGSRFLLSDYRVPAKPSPGGGDAAGIYSNFIPAESFLQAYAVVRDGDAGVKGEPVLYADLSLSTAARLSATFPIVSSGTRIPPAYTPHAYHFLDGGYFDNDGTASAIEFLKSAFDDPDKNAKNYTIAKPLKILLIEIRDDDGTGVTTDMDTLAHQDGFAPDTKDKTLQAPRWTPLTQLTGIAGGLWNAGHVSIARRNRRELCILEKAYSDQLVIRHIVFTIPNGKDGLSPLSWKLTAGQRYSIDHRASSPETVEALQNSVSNVKQMLGLSIDPSVAIPESCSSWQGRH